MLVRTQRIDPGPVQPCTGFPFDDVGGGFR